MVEGLGKTRAALHGDIGENLMLVMCASRYSRARRENSGARKFRGNLPLPAAFPAGPHKTHICTNKGDIHANAA
nr:hypothetical protein [uncultured Ottowia sp.]